jgi:hypothetical protein
MNRRAVAAAVVAAATAGATAAWLQAAERNSRRLLGMPAHHPEHVARPYLHGRWNVLQVRLWPGQEYVDVIEEERRGRGGYQ